MTLVVVLLVIWALTALTLGVAIGARRSARARDGAARAWRAWMDFKLRVDDLEDLLRETRRISRDYRSMADEAHDAHRLMIRVVSNLKRSRMTRRARRIAP